jgi:hypothetical protein
VIEFVEGSSPFELFRPPTLTPAPPSTSLSSLLSSPLSLLSPLLSSSPLHLPSQGAFRNLAIQFHYGTSSHERQLLMHYDHVFSALHMAVTLNGNRTTSFSVNHKEEVCLDLAKGLSTRDYFYRYYKFHKFDNKLIFKSHKIENNQIFKFRNFENHLIFSQATFI